jgi:PAS domain S-box-containing protein
MVIASNFLPALHYDAEPRAARPRAHADQPSIADELSLGVLFDRLLDAVVVARLTTGRIVLWNAAAERLFGYTAEEVVGIPIEMLMPEPIARLHRAGIERYRRTGHGLIVDARGPVEMPAVTRRGEGIRIELALSELQSSSGERFALAVIRDAMARKQLELTHLELAQARVAHSEAETELADRDDLLEATSALLGSAPSATELQRAARTLTDVRRLQRGELAIHAMEADVVDVVHAACGAARRRAAGRRILIHTPPTAPARFDPGRFRQALDAVLDLATRHAPEGARVEVLVQLISPHVVHVAVLAEGDKQLGPPDLGLHLSRALMRRQRGALTIDFPERGGLEVILTLPGTPHPPRRRPSLARKPGRAVGVS